MCSRPTTSLTHAISTQDNKSDQAHVFSFIIMIQKCQYPLSFPAPLISRTDNDMNGFQDSNKQRLSVMSLFGVSLWMYIITAALNERADINQAVVMSVEALRRLSP